MNIIDEIADWQCRERIAGRNPATIPLTTDQRARLERWCKSTTSKVTHPSGLPFVVPGVIYSGGMIMGMRYDP